MLNGSEAFFNKDTKMPVLHAVSNLLYDTSRIHRPNQLLPRVLANKVRDTDVKREFVEAALLWIPHRPYG
ncbi:hypothetical protein D3C77_447270 [compost metagenome]